MGALKSYRPKSGTPKPQLFIMHKMVDECVLSLPEGGNAEFHSLMTR